MATLYGWAIETSRQNTINITYFCTCVSNFMRNKWTCKHLIKKFPENAKGSILDPFKPALLQYGVNGNFALTIIIVLKVILILANTFYFYIFLFLYLHQNIKKILLERFWEKLVRVILELNLFQFVLILEIFYKERRTFYMCRYTAFLINMAV